MEYEGRSRDILINFNVIFNANFCDDCLLADYDHNKRSARDIKSQA